MAATILQSYHPGNGLTAMEADETVYPMRLPHGIRALARIGNAGSEMFEVTEAGDLGQPITGFVPHIMDLLQVAWSKAIESRSLPGFTPAQVDKYKDGCWFELIIHDRTSGLDVDTTTAFLAWQDEPDWPASSTNICAAVLLALPNAAILSGSDKSPMWLRRAAAANMLRLCGVNPGMDTWPKPSVYPLAMSPADPAIMPSGRACRFESPDYWRAIANATDLDHRAALVVNYQSGWSLKGKQFFIVTEDDLL